MIFFKKVILGFREIIHKDPPKGDRMKKFSYKGGLSKMALFNGSVLARLNPARWLFNLLYIARRIQPFVYCQAHGKQIKQNPT